MNKEDQDKPCTYHDLLAAFDSLVAKGLIEWFIDPNGNRRCRLTQAGIKYQESPRNISDEPEPPGGEPGFFDPNHGLDCECDRCFERQTP